MSMEEIQENEIQALKAIYMDDFKPLKAAWNSNLHEFSIAVYSSEYERSNAPVSLELVFRLPRLYPQESPHISIQQPVGLSEEHAQRLLSLIRVKLQDLLGNEVVFEIVDFVKEELESHSDSFKSFYDDYQKREKLKEIKDIKTLQISEREALEESRRMAEQVEREVQSRKEKSERGKNVDSKKLISLEDPLPLWGLTRSAPIYYVIKGPCVSRGSFFRKYLAFLDEEEDFMGTVVEVEILNPMYGSAFGKNKIQHILSQIKTCVNIPNSGLLSVFAAQVTSGDSPCLQIVTEYEDESSSLAAVLDRCLKMSVSAAVSITKQIVSLLLHLESLGIRHNYLCLEHIYLSDLNNVKLGWYHFWREIFDCHISNPFNSSSSHEKGLPWQSSDNPSDVVSLGVIFCQLLYGKNIVIQFGTFEDFWKNESESVPESVADLLGKIFGNERDRPSLSTILHSPSLCLTLTSGFLGFNSDLNINAEDQEPIYQPKSASRYQNDFEELEFLGKGGFGEVMKVRNKLDNRIYAIKRIKMNPKEKEYNKKILREVLTLSRLHHDYVVRYYQAWLESSAFEVSKSGAGNATGYPPNSTYTYDLDESEEDSLSGRNDWISAEISKSGTPINSFGGNPLFRMQDEDGTVTDGEDSFGEGWQNDDFMIQYLYIQMEYCANKTLRKVIDDGVEEEEAWRLFRQILEGLVHIHDQGMIHRDLKPSNILMDISGNVKIGDFGLAVLDNNAKNSGPRHVTIKISESSSSEIGTPIYSPPEQRDGLRYTQKVDMYSLGIIFFEMCYPFSTAMERLTVLRELREKNEFPSNFNPKREKERRIVNWLLVSDPVERPTSIEVFQSDLLPIQLEKSYVEEAIRRVANPSASYYQKLMRVLMSQEWDRHKDLIYDAPDYKEKISLFNLQSVRDRLSVIFKRHCAIELFTPLLQPKYHTEGNVFKVLDQSGNLLELPYSITSSFARFVARNNIHDLKRFCFDRVYRSNVFGGPPKQILACDFDIVHSGKTVKFLYESEILKVTQEVLDSFAYLSNSEYNFVVNIMSIVNEILDFCLVPKDIHGNVIKVLGSLGSLPLNKIQDSLIELKISQKSIEQLMKFIAIEGSIDDVESQLKKLSLETLVITEAFKDLRVVFKFSREFGVCRRILICPCLTYGSRSYDGLIFQAVLDSKKSRDIFAAGGRYDSLVKGFRMPGSGANTKPISAVGVNFALGKLMSIQDSYDNSASRSIDVLVCAFGRDVTEKLSILNILWNANVSAEIVLDDTGSMNMEEVTNRCKLKKIPWLLILKEKSSRSIGSFRIRSIEKRIEVEVTKEDLAKNVAGLVSGLYGISAAGIFKQKKDVDFLRSISSSEVSLANNVNVSIISTNLGKLKYAQKSYFIEKAQKAANLILEHIINPAKIVEILIMDLEGSIMKRLISGNIRDEEFYRRMCELAGSHRENVEKYRTNYISALDSKRIRFFILYSYRDDISDLKLIQ